MKILFVYSFEAIEFVGRPVKSWTSIQFGVSYISAVLKKYGHICHLVVLRSNAQEESRHILESAISESAPDMICLTSVYTQYCFILDIASYIRHHWPDIFLMIGGTHATLNPEEVINGPFNAVCIGEGEFPVLEACSQLQAGNYPRMIDNLWIKDDKGNIERNPTRNFIQDLDSLPFPDRDIWTPWVEEQEDAGLSILLGRGCPYDCTYCSNHALRNVSKGKYVRVRSPKNIITEIEYVTKKYNSSNIYLEVESIGVFKQWALDLCDCLVQYNQAGENEIKYGCNIRVSASTVDDRLFTKFKEANIKYLNIGLESGSEKIRLEVLKRNYSNQQFIDTVALARKYGIKIYTYNLIGIPGETLIEHYDTVKLNRICQPDGLNTSIFFPYPGTELYKVCKEQRLIDDSNNHCSERQHTVLRLPDFSRKQIVHCFRWMNYRVYRGHKPGLTMFIHAATVLVRSNATTYNLYRYLLRIKTVNSLRKLFRLSWKR